MRERERGGVGDGGMDEWGGRWKTGEFVPRFKRFGWSQVGHPLFQKADDSHIYHT